MLLVYTIILNYNSSTDTVRLYNTLKSSSFYETIPLVIDNSENNFQEQKNLTKAIPKKNLILNNKNLGYAAGNNIGIRQAINNNADYIFILNPDIKLKDKTLDILVQTLEKHPDMAAVGPRICFDNNPDTIYSDGGLVYPEKGYIVHHLHHLEKSGEVSPEIYTNIQYINGSAILIKAKVIKDIGYLNESFFLYYEETDLCMRMTDKKWSIATNAEAYAYHTSSIKGTTFYYYLTRNRIWLAKLRDQYILEAITSTLRPLYHETINSLKKLKQPESSYWPKIKGLLHGLFLSPKKNNH